MNRYEILSPRNALNKAYLKVKPIRSQIDSFKTNLIGLLDDINENESEEFHKNLISRFLTKTYYSDRYLINTKERADMAIYSGKDAKSSVSVIVEAKKPSNKYEMLAVENINTKALHELLLYFLRERITRNNLEIKHLIVTNIYEWFIFDASVFERLFVKNRILINQFKEFEEKRLSGTNTDFFYKDIAAPFVGQLNESIPFIHFDLRDIEKIVRSKQKDKDTKLVPYFKVFSPEHLLKLPFTNDSNSLDQGFYTELLHIIGLEETKIGSKKVIGRKAEGNRNAGSLIENTIMVLQYDDCLANIKRSDFGITKEDQLYNVSLELVITWVNRILFLKLLEAQLKCYHSGNDAYRFVDIRWITGFDELNKLFFRVLAVPEEERDEQVKKKYANVPYLNSSLFEPSELEHKTIRISNLEDTTSLPILGNTVLKDHHGKRVKGEMNALHYLFRFLDAYDFASEGSEDIQEENKTLINASVLGLIFEKINGYKDGAFFTPGFITMYMSRETIRRAVVQKFNHSWNWNCKNFDELKEDLYEKIKNSDQGRDSIRQEANDIINSLRICDPAVGSGHFLVSALNELIAIKSALHILIDLQGKTLNNYDIEVANDELSITDLECRPFKYHPGNKESQRIQETLFHEKQILIENCLFGVDINPNSVKICRLRLWIELLKNAYYKDGEHLETLPNIDINIKCNSSLINRYALDADIKKALRNSKWTIDSYQLAVQTYREASSKDQKREMERLIKTIKEDFENEIAANDKRVVKLNKLKGELFALANQQGLFELTKTQKTAFNKKAQKLSFDIAKLETKLQEIRGNKIYENAFEWRFEFPEILNDEGDFVGFDVVIGNPPYGVNISKQEKNFYSEFYNATDDIYTLFIEKGSKIINEHGLVAFITPIFWLTGDNYLKTRKFIYEKASFLKGITLPYDIFADAYVDTGIYFFSRGRSFQDALVYEFNPKDKVDYYLLSTLTFSKLSKKDWSDAEEYKIIMNPTSRSFLRKLNGFEKKIDDLTDSVRGILADKEDYSDDFNNGYQPIFWGKLDRYYLEKNQMRFVKYGPNLKEKPSSIDFFYGERILVRRIVSRQFRIMATFTDQTFITKKDIYIFKKKSDDVSLKFLLAIINSKLISYFKTKSSAAAKKDDFTQVTLGDIREISIPDVPAEILNIIVNKTDQILSAKEQSPDAVTSAIEADIDLLIYKAYGLTWDEVRIVDPDFKMGEEEYNTCIEADKILDHYENGIAKAIVYPETRDRLTNDNVEI